MRLFTANRLPVPRDLAGVTDHDPGREVDPRDADLAPAAIARIWAAVEALYRSGLHPGIQIVLRRRGQVVLDRAIGYAEGMAGDASADARRPLLRDTPICLFSASKAVTAMLVHALAEQGRFGLDDAIADYIPEYAQAGKAHTTIAQLLAHQAGIPRLPMRRPDPELLWDWERTLALLCAARPAHAAGQQAYHAVTAGYILGELLRRVSGESLPDLLRRHFAEPLGARWLSYGLPVADQPLAARNAFTGGRLLPGVAQVARRALGIEFERVASVANSGEFMSAVIPAGNIYASADDVGRFFEMLLREGAWQGRQLLRPETVRRAVAPTGPIRIDRTLLVPVRFSMGMVLGERPFGLYGSNCREAYGHLGFMSIVCWADPARDISCALLDTGKTLSPVGVAQLGRLLAAISRACPRDA